MEQTFLTELKISRVRHLKDITIPLSQTERKNLVLTGKNGSGKTSVLKSLAVYLEYVVSSSFIDKVTLERYIASDRKEINNADNTESGRRKREVAKGHLSTWTERLKIWTEGCTAECPSIYSIREKYQSGRFVLAFYGDHRKLNLAEYKNIEKVDLKPVYEISDSPAKDLGRYLVNLKTTQAFAQTKGDSERAKEIEAWFDRFEGILRRLYHDDTLKLDFNIETFQFSILTAGREPFTFNTMSMGYAAVFDIIGDLIMRMESQHSYDLEGIVLIDEIETHLHVELQKEIVPILTELFPNIQFILTTHSPFVLSSAKNSVVFDLENQKVLPDGLTNLPYEGIVEGYFQVDQMSAELREKFEEYKALAGKQELTDADYERIVDLEYYLDEVPDFLAVEFAEEYSRIKLELDSRG